jgi:hypothetical protein
LDGNLKEIVKKLRKWAGDTNFPAKPQNSGPDVLKAISTLNQFIENKYKIKKMDDPIARKLKGFYALNKHATPP